MSVNAQRFVKRLLDALVAGVGLVVLAPVLIVVSAVIWVTMGRPILFRQRRPGRGEKLFTLLKFRTMTEQRDADGEPLPDGERLTRVGRALRRTSIDELPQLWNVLKGEMSLVGPRPLLAKYLDRYTAEQARRHEVKPGITGWAQVNGRNAITWEQKFEHDVWYVDNWSLGLDLRILGLTIGKVVRREGISEAGAATAEEFMGSGPRRGQREGGRQ